MKCQRCPKQATLHITEVLPDERFEELHLCEDCAKKYLYEPAAAQQQAAKKSGKPAADLDLGDDPGGKQCEACGIKFVEFRNAGRLGCSHDYDSFREELLPLLESIHGDVRHQGKTPRRLPKAKSAQAELAQLRKKLQQAVLEEAYEEAASIRDRIKQLEE
ncbi:MAG TPA: UvrB/UvrC motif-containing protein [Fimbriiglobus sp.]|jgi:protein arginine kinase activator|nr:UvrB/UvrC motif-containing protein [Fimbriiglobus sp.]